MSLLIFLGISRSSHQRCSKKKLFLEISQKSQKNTCARVSFFNNVTGKARVPIFSEPLVGEVAQNKNGYKRSLFLKHFNFFRTSTQRQDFQNSCFFHKAAASKELHCQISFFLKKASFWKQLIFQKSNVPKQLLFLESYFFRAASF